jgi:hypothetical protein
MWNMFAETQANGFNQDIDAWNVSNVTNMLQMFYINPLMNRSLNSWNTSKVTSMNLMFFQAQAFNGNIGNWNVSSVNTMTDMFFQAYSFNRDISNWNFRGINATANLDRFMTSATAFSTANYNALLVSMNNNKSSAPYRSDLRPGFSATYTASSAAAAARAALVTYGWTITDGGTVNAAPDAPTSVSGTAGNTTVSLSWLAPVYNNGSSITDYIIQHSGNNASSWTTFNDGVSTALTGNITGLTNDISYTFRVAAVNSVGTGEYSNSSSTITASAPSFTPMAVLLTSGSSYTVPAGATSMKAWAVGAGGNSASAGYLWGGAGGCAYKTWSVLGGQSVTYSCGSTTFSHGNNSTVTFNAVSITGYGGRADGTGGSYSGGDGGANGGTGDTNGFDTRSGAVGGNAGTIAVCGRRAATDVNGLLAAVALAGGKSVEDCGATAAFGSSSFNNKNNNKAPGYGGGFSGGFNNTTTGPGAVVLYFT